MTALKILFLWKLKKNDTSIHPSKFESKMFEMDQDDRKG